MLCYFIASSEYFLEIASCLCPFQNSHFSTSSLANLVMSTLDERLSARLSNDAIPGRQNPFDEPTNALQKRFDISSYGIKGASVDHGFGKGAVPIATGAAKEREMKEYERKEEAWKCIKAWSEQGEEGEKRVQWTLVAYRHTVSFQFILRLFFHLSLMTPERYSCIRSITHPSGICTTDCCSVMQRGRDILSLISMNLIENIDPSRYKPGMNVRK